MISWFLILFMILIVPLTVGAFGFYLVKTDIEDMNPNYGYYSKVSVSSKEAWNFSQKFAGKTWTVFGMVTIVIALTIMIALLNSTEDVIKTVGITITYSQIGSFFILCFWIENELKKRFNIFENKDI